MEKERTITEAKISNLDELTKVLPVKKEAKKQLLIVMQTFSIGKIVRNLKFEEVQGFTLSSLFIKLVIVFAIINTRPPLFSVWGKSISAEIPLTLMWKLFVNVVFA